MANFSGLRSALTNLAATSSFLFWAMAVIVGGLLTGKVLWELSHFGLYYIALWNQTQTPLWKIVIFHSFLAMAIAVVWRFVTNEKAFGKVSESAHQTDAIIAAIYDRPPR